MGALLLSGNALPLSVQSCLLDSEGGDRQQTNYLRTSSTLTTMGAALSWTTAQENVRSVDLQPYVGVPSLVQLVGDRKH